MKSLQILFFFFFSFSFILTAEKTDKRMPLRVHFISGAKEYRSAESLKKFKIYLEKHERVAITASWVEDKAKNLPAFQKIKEADVLVVFARRLDLPEHQMAIIRAHWEAQKGIVGIRTASHAFSAEENKTFDLKVLGGNYKGHFGNEVVSIESTSPGKAHPLTKGLTLLPSQKLYKAGNLFPSTIVLQTGTITQDDGSLRSHPVTWITPYAKNGNAFYTSLGIPADFDSEPFLEMLARALFWSTHRDIAGK